MNLFHKIHLQAFNVISVVVYHGGPTFGQESGGLSPPDFDMFPKLKKPLRGKRFRSIEEVSNEVP
jgi:peptidoglycan/LPS O-acetylase OafA/YrhL